MSFKDFLFCTALSLVVFLSANYLFSGSLESQDSLAKELQSSEGSLSDWNISLKAPFKYRPLFKATVYGIYHLTGLKSDSAFFWTYWALSLSLFTVLFNLVFLLLREHSIPGRMARFGLLLFALSPPILFAYTLPVHTREDILGYCLLFLGFIFCRRNKFIPLFLVSILAAMTRETLLILPLYYLLTTRFSLRSVALLSTCLLIFIGIRFLYGIENYDYWQGLIYNLDNPIIVAGFVFLSFHILWLPYLIISLADIKKSIRQDYVILVLILISTLLLGQANEIRLIFIFSPILFITLIAQFTSLERQFIDMINSAKFRWISLIVMLFIVPVFVVANNYLTTLNMDNPYNIPLFLWLNAGLVYFALFVISLPFCNILIKQNFAKVG